MLKRSGAKCNTVLIIPSMGLLRQHTQLQVNKTIPLHLHSIPSVFISHLSSSMLLKHAALTRKCSDIIDQIRSYAYQQYLSNQSYGGF